MTYTHKCIILCLWYWIKNSILLSKWKKIKYRWHLLIKYPVKYWKYYVQVYFFILFVSVIF